MTAAHSSDFLSDSESLAVVSRLSGGLGNQLFQYAAGRSLAARTKSRLILDAGAFAVPAARRTYALSGLAIAADVISSGYVYPPTEVVAELPCPIKRTFGLGGRAERLLRSLARRAVSRQTGTNSFAVFTEKSFDYDPRFADLGARTYLVGYWQSERYFVEVEEAIRGEVRLVAQPNSVSASWLARMRDRNAVCVHVRRGDYLMPAHYEHHGVCSAEYYLLAMELMRTRIENPVFFLFSDDREWCRGNLCARDMLLVDANGPDAAQDELRLMGACRHHIIANSSLSWWAAWLARNDDQVVIAPMPWFTKTRETPDLYPRGWLVLPRR